MKGAAMTTMKTLTFLLLSVCVANFGVCSFSTQQLFFADSPLHKVIFLHRRGSPSHNAIKCNCFFTLRYQTTTRIRLNKFDNGIGSDESSFLSDDPFKILGLDEPTVDKKVLKRAYKRRALKYHPDVVTDVHSSPEDKRKASDRFAKINWAYDILTKNGGKAAGSSDRSSSSSSSSSKGTPPHRRAGAYSTGTSSSSSSSKTVEDWRDYIPNYGNYKYDYDNDNDDYGTGGDSFGKIFSDLFTNAAVGAVGATSVGKGIFSEFMDFLEGNIGDGINNGSNWSSSSINYDSNLDDDELKGLIKNGSFEAIAEEMHDTELVVGQLEAKESDLSNEIFLAEAEAKMTARFSEKIKLEERLDELKARKNVVEGYLKRARKRLLSLQTRYKELITFKNTDDQYVRNRGDSGRRRGNDNSSNGRYSSYSASSDRENTADTSSSTGTNVGSYSSSGASKTDSWKTESFGSSRRGSRSRRGSGRRRATRRTTMEKDPNTSSSVASNEIEIKTFSTNSDASKKDSWKTESFGSPRGSSRSRRGNGGQRVTRRTTKTVQEEPNTSSSAAFNDIENEIFSTSYSPRSSDSYSYNGSNRARSQTAKSSSTSPSSSSLDKYGEIPPHRRSQSYVSRNEEDRRRLKEIKVDEEFDKLKKELGLS